MNGDRGRRLGAYLSAALRTPWAWGTADCALFAADWLLRERGLDAADGLRGHYRTELGCARLLKRRGGLEAVFAAQLDPHLARTAAPQLGDVGLVLARTPRGVQPVGAIRSDRRWVSRSANGLVSGPTDHLLAWTV